MQTAQACNNLGGAGLKIKCGKNIYLCFIDYEKAFDRVKHAKIIECMENLDIDGKDISLIRNLYCAELKKHT